jgi:hypothetical protein
LPIADGIKDQRRQCQPDHRRQIADAAQREIAGQGDRQEQEDKQIGIEEHQAFLKRIQKPNHTTWPSTTLRADAFWQLTFSTRYRSNRA